VLDFARIDLLGISSKQSCDVVDGGIAVSEEFSSKLEELLLHQSGVFVTKENLDESDKKQGMQFTLFDDDDEVINYLVSLLEGCSDFSQEKLDDEQKILLVGTEGHKLGESLQQTNFSDEKTSFEKTNIVNAKKDVLDLEMITDDSNSDLTDEKIFISKAKVSALEESISITGNSIIVDSALTGDTKETIKIEVFDKTYLADEVFNNSQPIKIIGNEKSLHTEDDPKDGSYSTQTSQSTTDQEFQIDKGKVSDVTSKPDDFLRRNIADNLLTTEAEVSRSSDVKNIRILEEELILNKIKITVNEKLADKQDGRISSLTKEHQILSEVKPYQSDDSNSLYEDDSVKTGFSLDKPIINEQAKSQWNQRNISDESIKTEELAAVESLDTSQGHVQKFALDQMHSVDASLTEIDSQDLINQVAEKIEFYQEFDSEKLVIQLKPNELGKVTIDVVKNAKGYVANIVVESEAIKTCLREKSNELSAVFSSRSMTLNNLNISVKNDNLVQTNLSSNQDNAQSFFSQSNSSENRHTHESRFIQNEIKNKALVKDKQYMAYGHSINVFV
jgi:flagellar hook-length control protein FliK